MHESTKSYENLLIKFSLSAFPEKLHIFESQRTWLISKDIKFKQQVPR